ncbi:hypothetical protein tinsulaeT_03100 [Thalassotalea insulae]|uniref:PEP-CTERM sorting domain-containing protein n=1 Tax=Thalassotalea insulae TaxID=2056778 RepID=A0ABQ6GQL6_9GAMM|nr:hypothetical protein [Thalassotalea insulae]GLX76970.1 hypothetical protein tinsulaeT_03100 [Thalassotalea insulae]
MKHLFLLLTFIVSISSQATIIALDFDQAEYDINDTITGQLVASDLSYTLGGFAGTISFDSSSLALTGWSFGNGFDDGFGSYSFADDSISGSLYLDDYADLFADEAMLIANQGANFVLASFSFTALTAGAHTVNLDQGLEVVSFDNLMLDTFDQQSASFQVSQVPEPMTSLLFASCLVLLARKRC